MNNFFYKYFSNSKVQIQEKELKNSEGLISLQILRFTHILKSSGEVVVFYCGFMDGFMIVTINFYGTINEYDMDVCKPYPQTKKYYGFSFRDFKPKYLGKIKNLPTGLHHISKKFFEDIQNEFTLNPDIKNKYSHIFSFE